MKRILLIIMAAGILLLGACNGGSVELTHYVNEQYGYSIDYPSDWLLEELSDNETGVMPPNANYNQIQISSFPGEPTLDLMEDEAIRSTNESVLQLLADQLEALEMEITVNERSEEQWDWVVEFTISLQGDVTLEGGLLIKETPTITYNIFYIQSADWPEGQEVIDSFTPLGISEPEADNGN
jgi:hypothetical protein